MQKDNPRTPNGVYLGKNKRFYFWYVWPFWSSFLLNIQNLSSYLSSYLSTLSEKGLQGLIFIYTVLSFYLASFLLSKSFKCTLTMYCILNNFAKEKPRGEIFQIQNMNGIFYIFDRFKVKTTQDKKKKSKMGARWWKWLWNATGHVALGKEVISIPENSMALLISFSMYHSVIYTMTSDH